MDIFKGMPYGIKEIITNRMIASVAISPTGAIIPLLDTAAITAIWANMLYEIAKYHDVTLTTEEWAEAQSHHQACREGYITRAYCAVCQT